MVLAAYCARHSQSLFIQHDTLCAQRQSAIELRCSNREEHVPYEWTQNETLPAWFKLHWMGHIVPFVTRHRLPFPLAIYGMCTRKLLWRLDKRRRRRIIKKIIVWKDSHSDSSSETSCSGLFSFHHSPTRYPICIHNNIIPQASISPCKHVILAS